MRVTYPMMPLSLTSSIPTSPVEYPYHFAHSYSESETLNVLQIERKRKRISFFYLAVAAKGGSSQGIQEVM